jgi:hypothetical protein
MVRQVKVAAKKRRKEKHRTTKSVCDLETQKREKGNKTNWRKPK